MAYTTVQISELACNIFSQWCLNNVNTINLISIERNVYHWVFWQGSEMKSIVVLVKGSTKTIENLYFQKAKYSKGLILEMPCHTQVTHVLWVDVNNGDSALVLLANLSTLLQSRTDANDFNSFKSQGNNIYIVPLDYLECENIGVRCRNLLSA